MFKFLTLSLSLTKPIIDHLYINSAGTTKMLW